MTLNDLEWPFCVKICSTYLPPLQSGFRPSHSTESAILCVLSDILLAVDRGDFAALVLLHLSAAFDTVDYDILLQRLESSFGIADVARDCMVPVVTVEPKAICLLRMYTVVCRSPDLRRSTRLGVRASSVYPVCRRPGCAF